MKVVVRRWVAYTQELDAPDGMGDPIAWAVGELDRRDGGGHWQLDASEAEKPDEFRVGWCGEFRTAEELKS